ncbi:MAG: ATP synthase F1 subunit epsilon [Bacteroidota bacterium]
MELVVLTPEKEIFSGAITSVRVPGVSGRFEVKNNHTPIVAALKEGLVQITPEGGQDLNFNVKRGFIEVLNNEVALLVQGIEEI